jgi:hypothetical protein
MGTRPTSDETTMATTTLRIWDDGISKGPGLVIGETKVSDDQLKAITDRASAIAAGIPEHILKRYEAQMRRFCGNREDYSQCVNWLLYKANPRIFSGNPITGR